ncbi:MAG: hypothetical protein GY953_31030, partial [bacterium]|nr:hypothetical protein [bacterium]
SPDSRWIAFDSSSDGNKDIYVVGAEGIGLRRRTTKASYDGPPSWSGDGRWIYFGSDRSGERQVWKIPAEEGPAEQVTRNRGSMAFEAPGGELLYYFRSTEARHFVDGAIWKVPVGGGEETRVLDNVLRHGWAVHKDGICYLDRAPGSTPALRFLRFATGQRELLTLLPDEAYPGGMAVSPDGRWVLYAQDHGEADIMLMENFGSKPEYER